MLQRRQDGGDITDSLLIIIKDPHCVCLVSIF